MWQRQPVSLRRLFSLILCLLWISLAPAFAQPGPDDALNAANADLDRVQASIESMAQDDAALGAADHAGGVHVDGAALL